MKPYAFLGLLVLLCSTQADAANCPNGQCGLPTARSIFQVQRPVLTRSAPAFAWETAPVMQTYQPVQQAVQQPAATEFAWEQSAPARVVQSAAPTVVYQTPVVVSEEVCYLPAEVVTETVESATVVCAVCGKPLPDAQGVVTYSTTAARKAAPAPVRRRLFALRQRPVYERQTPVVLSEVNYGYDSYGNMYTETVTTSGVATSRRYRLFDRTGWRPFKALRTRRMNKALGY